MDDLRLSTIHIDIEAATGDSEARINRLADALDRLGRRRNTSVNINATGNSSREATKKVNSLNTALGKLTRAFGRILFYRAIRNAIKAVGDAFKQGGENAYFFSKMYGKETAYIAQSLDQLASAGWKMQNQLGAAWDTLLADIAPALLKIIELITRAAEVVTQFFAILGGKTTFLKATNYAKNWADYTDKGAKAAKEWKNQLLAFDEINRLEAPTNNAKGNNKNNYDDYENMFEEAEIEPWAQHVINMIDEIKDKLITFWEGLDFEPLIKAFKRLWAAMQDVYKLAKGGLKWVLENVLAPLAKWTVEKALPDTLNLLAEALEALARIDFTAFKQSLENLFTKLQPLAGFISQSLHWALKNVLEPLAKWTIEDAAPLAIDVLSTALDTLRIVTEKLKPLGQWVWDNFLKPLGEWTGENIMSGLTQLQSALEKLNSFLSGDLSFEDFINSMSLTETYMLGLAGVIVGFALSLALSGIGTAVLNFLTNPFTRAAGAIVASIDAFDRIGAALDEYRKTGEMTNEISSQIYTGIAEVFFAFALLASPWMLIPAAAAGAVGFLKTKWDSLTEEVRGAVVGIEEVVGLSSFVTGAILAFSGVNIPAGIALMAAGAVLGGDAYVNFKELPHEIQLTIAEIEDIVSKFSLGLGIMLVLSRVNIAGGLGLIAAGLGLGLHSTDTLSSDSVSEEVRRETAKMDYLFGAGEILFGALLCFTGGTRIFIGLSMIAAGAAEMYKAARIDSTELMRLINKTIGLITGIGGSLELALGVILLCTGNIPMGLLLLGAGLISLGYFASQDWSYDPLLKQIRDAIGAIFLIGGMLMFAMGVILLCTGNLPVGLTMLLAGMTLLAIGGQMMDNNPLIAYIQGVLDGIGEVFNAWLETLWRNVTEALDIVNNWLSEHLGFRLFGGSGGGTAGGGFLGDNHPNQGDGWATGGNVPTGPTVATTPGSTTAAPNVNVRAFGGSSKDVSADIVDGMESANEPVVTAIYAIGSQIVNAMASDDGGGVSWDNFVRNVTRTQRRQADAYGV